MIFTYFHFVCCNEHAGYGVSCVQQDFRNRYRSEWNGLFFLWWKTTMCCNIVRKHFWEKQIIDMVPCQYIAPMDCDIVWTYYRQIHHKSNKHKLIIYYLVVTFIHQFYIIYTSFIHHLYIIYTSFIHGKKAWIYNIGLLCICKKWLKWPGCSGRFTFTFVNGTSLRPCTGKTWEGKQWRKQHHHRVEEK